MTTILCIEDEPLIRSEILKELQGAGYETIEAENGLDGLHAIIEHRPDLVLSDVKMPVMTGLEMLKTLRNDYPELKGIPFIFLSGLANRDDVIGAKLLGADEYVTKPIDFVNLLAVLDIRLEQVSRIKNIKKVEMAELRETILKTLTYELRTAIHPIIGFSEILAEESLGPMGNGLYVEYGRKIYASALDLLDIVNNTLSLADVVSGHVKPEKTPYDIVELVTECTKAAAAVARKNTIRLQVDAGPPIPRMQTDRNLLTQAVSSLLSNAIKFSRSGDLVRVKIRFENKAGYKITITDTGNGIASQDISAIFKNFEQLDWIAQRKYQGVGLGLTFAKTVTVLLGGAFDLRSAHNKGTTASMIFPIVNRP